MTAITLPNSGLAAGYVNEESGWGAGMNANLRALDALVQARVIDKDLSAPPASPTSGALYIVGAAPTGAWAGNAGKLALWQAGDDLTAAWRFITPKSGWLVFVVDENQYYRYDGAAWLSGIVTITPVKQALSFGTPAVETLAVTAGVANFIVPFNFTLQKIIVGLATAQTTGSLLTVQVRKAGTALLSPKITMDNNERTSTTATTAGALVTPNTPLLEGDEITVDVDQIGDGTAKGLKIYLVGIAT